MCLGRDATLQVMGLQLLLVAATATLGKCNTLLQEGISAQLCLDAPIVMQRLSRTQEISEKLFSDATSSSKIYTTGSHPIPSSHTFLLAENRLIGTSRALIKEQKCMCIYKKLMN